MKTEGDIRKSIGMDQVLGATNHEWAAKYDALAVEFYKNLQPGMRFTGEDMRDFIEHQVKENPINRNHGVPSSMDSYGSG